MTKASRTEARSRRERLGGREKRVNALMISLGVCGGAIALSLVLWSLIGPSLRAPDRAKALRVGNETYTAAEFNFYYFGAYHSLLSKGNGYENLMGLDSSKNLADQTCTVSDKKESWRDYFTDQAKDTLSRMSVDYSEAVKAGYTATPEVKSSVDDVVEYYEVQGKSEGFANLESYLTATYGKGMTETVLRGLMEKTYVGKAYTDDLKAKYHFSDAQLREYYGKHAAENSAYSYLYAFAGGQSSQTCGRLVAAKSRSEFESLARKLTGSPCSEMRNVSGADLGTASTKDVAWLTDSARKAGETFVGQSGENRYVLYFLSRSDSGYGSGAGSDWITAAKTGLSADTFAAWENGLLAKYGVAALGGMQYARSVT